MAKHYKLIEGAAEDEFLEFEAIGTGLKRVGTNGLKSDINKALPRGRTHGTRARGWTVDTRRTNREYLEENRDSFRSMMHLRFGPGCFHDPVKLRSVRDRLTRFLRRKRKKLEFDYHWVLEFAERSTDPHFHIAVTIVPRAEIRAKFNDYWRSLGGDKFTWEAKLNDKVEAIARYSAKSRTKTNPDWFEVAPFQPYGKSFRKKKRDRIRISSRDAAKAGLLKHRFTHDGVSKLSEKVALEVSPLSGLAKQQTSKEVSPLPDIHTKSDTDDTTPIPVPLLAYRPPFESDLMAKACRFCWRSRGRYVSRIKGAESCDQCGNVWVAAI